MRLIPPLLAALCALMASCSSDDLAGDQSPVGKGVASVKNIFQRDHIGGYTRADLANLRMRDLNPMANTPPVVQVRQSTLREIPRERMAFFKGFSWFNQKPVDYTPPTLPAGALALDGGLLPAKSGRGAAVANPGTDPPRSHLAANRAGTDQENANGFSIE